MDLENTPLTRCTWCSRLFNEFVNGDECPWCDGGEAGREKGREAGR